MTQDCPICSSTGWTPKYKISDWTIDECQSCLFSKINPYPSDESRPEFFSEKENEDKPYQKKRTGIKKIAAEIKRSFKNISRRDKHDIFYKKLNRTLKPGSHVLDIACADGAFILNAKKGFKFTGIDINEHLVNLARKANPESDFMVGDFTFADFGGKTFDGITIISLIEHLRDPIHAIQKSYELLNKDGVFFLKTVNYNSINRKVAGQKWSGFRPPDHIIHFTPQNLTRALKQAGFRRVSVSAFPFNDNMYLDAVK